MKTKAQKEYKKPGHGVSGLSHILVLSAFPFADEAVAAIRMQEASVL